jgi:hypothetical protein
MELSICHPNSENESPREKRGFPNVGPAFSGGPLSRTGRVSRSLDTIGRKFEMHGPGARATGRKFPLPRHFQRHIRKISARPLRIDGRVAHMPGRIDAHRDRHPHRPANRPQRFLRHVGQHLMNDAAARLRRRRNLRRWCRCDRDRLRRGCRSGRVRRNAANRSALITEHRRLFFRRRRRKIHRPWLWQIPLRGLRRHV